MIQKKYTYIKRYCLILSFLILVFPDHFGHANPPSIVVTIKPIHGLVCALLEGHIEMDRIHLLCDSLSSPHTLHLKPSQIHLLHHASLIIWVGASYEHAMAPVIEKIRAITPSKRLKIMALDQTENMDLLPPRFTKSHQACHNHGKIKIDGHFFLNPAHGIKIVSALCHVLEQELKLDLSDNFKKLVLELQTLTKVFKDSLAPYRTTPYAVYHDFLNYIDHAFKIQCVSVISPSPEMPIVPIQIQKWATLKTPPWCLFIEPQFKGPICEVLKIYFAIPIVELDYLGSTVPKGPRAYFDSMYALLNSMISGFQKKEIGQKTQ